MFEGEFYFFEFGFGIRKCSVNDARLEVGGEEAGIQDEHGHEGGDSELTNFEDVVSEMLCLIEFELSPVRFESHGATRFVGYPIEIG